MYVKFYLNACLKGGELASCVHRFVRHGDERVTTLARRLLTALTYPLLLMLTRWLLHGT
jgi:type II secretory pathway component PulF